MPCASTIEEAISLAQQRWPGYEFKIKSTEEACGPCPICHEAQEDGFLIFASGFYWCRPGEHEGWLDENQSRTLTPEQIVLRRHEAELRRQARKQTELERRIAALERMAQCHDHERYHDQAINNTTAMEWFCAQGLWPVTVFDQKLGMCSRCPTDRQARPSYTFPVWRKDGPLWNIRHRLQDAHDGDKYRPHRAGLGRQLVNARQLADWADYVTVVEGVKKARVIEQYEVPVVGILGKSGFEIRWLNWFHPTARIVLALDPDAHENAWKLGHEIAKQGRDVRVAEFPRKPDDLFVNGATADEWLAYVKLARKVH